MKNNFKDRLKMIVRDALIEDVGTGDVTTMSVTDNYSRAEAVILAKENGVIAGLVVAQAVFKKVDKRCRFVAKVKDGAEVKKGKVIARVYGPAAALLIGERTALNFLQRLSGIATITHKFVKLAGRKTKILDTRKTTPGLRALEKYAVKLGGGTNHRFGLFDAALIKDNHIALAGGVEQALASVKKKVKGEVEIEAKTIAQVKKAIKAGADKILLDNMNLKTLRQAVKLCKNRRVWTEASGGVNLKTVRKIAATGVNSISVGALTHSAPALDISLEMI